MFNFFKKSETPKYSGSFNSLNEAQKESIVSLFLVLSSCDQEITKGTKEEEFAYINKHIETFNLKRQFTILERFGIDGIVSNLNELSISQKEHLIILAYDLLCVDADPNEMEMFTLFDIFEKLKFSQSTIIEILNTSNRNINEELYTENDSEIDQLIENFEQDKFFVSSVFYKFCFDSEVVSLFLSRNDQAIEIAKNMATTRFEHESVSLIMFKAFLRRYSGDFEYQQSGEFKYRSFEFNINVEKMVIESDNTYFEILTNDFTDVKNEDGEELAIATNYIVYVKNGLPNSIFVVIKDPYLEKYAIRKVSDNGISNSLGFIEDNDLDSYTTLIIDYLNR